MSEQDREQDRRAQEKKRIAELKRQLNPAQLDSLHDLEMLGWTLKFVRQKPFAAPIPVVVDAQGERHAVLNDDGSLNDNPGFTIRP